MLVFTRTCSRSTQRVEDPTGIYLRITHCFTCIAMQILLVTMKLTVDEFARVDLFIEVNSRIVCGGYQKHLYHLFVDVITFGISHAGLGLL